jgi:hypothetical protein
MPDFHYQPLVEHGHDETRYRRLETASAHVTLETEGDRKILRVGREATSRISCVPATWPSCARSSTTRTPRPTIASWRSSC